MEIVLATLNLDGPGGMQTYVLTVAPHLERLGHAVTLYSPEHGLISDLARSRGLRVARGEHELPESCDAVLAQDAVTALAMADRYPTARRAIVVHGAEYDVSLPPGIDRAVSCAIAMNGAVERRIRAMAAPPPVVRLRQPIDAARHYPVGVVRERPERVLMLGNYLDGRRRDALVQVCEDAGLAWRQVGIHGELLLDPVSAIADADIVIGQGRSVLEAMACGRAAWVYGPTEGDGWVTPSSYAELEADGFRARATDALLDAESFGRALADYRPSMGEANRGLVVLHHSAYNHAIELVGVLDGARAEPPADAPLRELARLVRTQFDAQSRVMAVMRDLRAAHARLAEAHQELGAAREQLGAANAELGAANDVLGATRAALAAAEEQHGALVRENERLEGELDAHRRALADVDGRLTGLVATRRWRAASLAARPLDLARRRRRTP